MASSETSNSGTGTGGSPTEAAQQWNPPPIPVAASPSEGAIPTFRGYTLNGFAIEVPNGQDVMDAIGAFTHGASSRSVYVIFASGHLKTLLLTNPPEGQGLPSPPGGLRILSLNGHYIARAGMKVVSNISICAQRQNGNVIAGGVANGSNVMVAEGPVQVVLNTNLLDFNLTENV